MRTLVYPPSGILGLGRSRTVGVIAHAMTDADAAAIGDQLAAQGIPVAVTHGPGGWVNLRPTDAVTTRQEARAIRIVEDVTDAPIAWNKAVTP